MLSRGVRQIFKIGIGLGSSFVLLYIAALLSLRISGFEYAVVVSNSMQPHTARGDLVILTPALAPQIGDVVTFRRGETIVLHRLAAKTVNGSWKTKGDNNPTADPWRIESSEITARAVGRLAGFGWPLLWLNSNGGSTAMSANWSNSVSKSAAVTSKTLTTTSYSLWTKFSADSFYLTTSDGGLRINGTGERRLYSRYLCPNLCRVHFEGNLSKVDVAKPEFNLLLNACPNSTDGITCGWVIRFQNQLVELRLVSTTGSIGNPLSSCALPASHALNTYSIYSVSRTSTGFLVTWNGSPCRLGMNQLASYPTAGFPNPTGDRFGFWLSGTNTLLSNRTNVR